MKERPILFSAPMVRAILDGSKTQTRRPVKKNLERIGDGDFYAFDHKGINYRVNARHSTVAAWAHLLQFCPYGHPGDRLWVRETWQHENYPLGPYDNSCTVFYRADLMDDPHGPDGEKSPDGKYRTWSPSIHMPRAASRILLEITAVRVERLQDISESDAIAEGANVHPDHYGKPRDSIYGPVQAYRDLWESINGPGNWDENPWVWVVEFRRINKQGA